MKTYKSNIVGISKIRDCKSVNGREYKRASLFCEYAPADIVGVAAAQVDIFANFSKYSVGDVVNIIYNPAKKCYEILEID